MSKMTAQRKKKKKPNKRNERHGAAWGGGRGWLLALILLASPSYGQNFRRAIESDGSEASGKISPDLAAMMANKSGAVRVIVQYRNAPATKQLSKAQFQGAKLNSNLSFIKAGAFTMSAAAVRGLASDRDVAFISPDPKLKAMDDLTDAAVGVSAA